MAQRVTGSVQRTQTNLRLAFESDDFVVFDQTIDVNVVQRFGSLRVCRDGNRAAEMCLECIDSTDVIRMQMSNDDLAHLPAFGDHFVNTLSQRLLFIFIR